MPTSCRSLRRKNPQAAGGGINETLVPEFLAVPVDCRVSLDVDVAFHTCLAGQAHLFGGIAENFQAQKGIEPFPESFQHSFFCDVFLAGSDHHITAAALSESHAIEDSVWSGIKLHSIPAGD